MMHCVKNLNQPNYILLSKSMHKPIELMDVKMSIF